MSSHPETKSSMTEETVESHYNEKRKDILKTKWKYLLLSFFVGGVLLECVNITLTSRCETQSHEASVLRSFLKTVTEQSITLGDIGIRLYDSTIENNTAVTAAEDVTTGTPRKPLCNPQGEFILQMSNKRVNVCTYQGQIRVDVRQFLNGQATVRGIYLNVREFQSLSDIFYAIRSEVDRQVKMLTI